MKIIIEDLFDLTDTLSNEDCLMIIYDGEPSEIFIHAIEHIFKHEQKFVVVMNIKRLQFNILEHKLSPQITICTEQEKEDIYKKYNIVDDSQMPEISRFDPLALAVCMRPGQVCKLVRTSPTSLTSDYYRLCS